MEFNIRCECGGLLLISEGAAGARVPCDCGRTVIIPSLDELRKQAGVPAPDPNPVWVIEDMLAHGELPTASTCVYCDSVTSDTMIVTAECEKTVSTGPTLIMWLFALWVLGIFAILLRQRDEAAYGRNLSLHLPVRLCRPCQRKITSRLTEFGLGFIAVLIAAIGVGQLATGVAWGWLILLGSALVCWTAIVASKRRRAALRNVLARERIYHQLLRRYPGARLLLAGDDGGSG
jgi:hypothetical protein